MAVDPKLREVLDTLDETPARDRPAEDRELLLSVLRRLELRDHVRHRPRPMPAPTSRPSATPLDAARKRSTPLPASRPRAGRPSANCRPSAMRCLPARRSSKTVSPSSKRQATAGR